ncbi:MAG: A/G-specific adenine glycosylase [Planctomycetales bacterium]
MSSLFSPRNLVAFRRALVAWYRRHARPLPWRTTDDPYRVWISEIMLQQTTVAAVVPYFERFLARFPDVVSLAAAPEQEILRHWEGLGYYSRARNIHKAARLVVDEHGGEFPQDLATLQRLPGIGRYTAGAIVSFAFDRPAPIVEANTLRLFCRLLGYRGDPRAADGQRLLWEFAEQLSPKRSPGRLNQALMELGGTLCTPDAPDCPRCPVRRWCQAFAQGSQEEIPRPQKRPTVTEVDEVAVVVERNGSYLLMQRPIRSRWGGLWDFVRFVSAEDSVRESLRRGARSVSKRESPREEAVNSRPSREGAPDERHFRCRLEQRVQEAAGIDVVVGELLTELRHSVTRYRIRLRCYLADWKSGSVPLEVGPSRWMSPEEFETVPLSVTGRKIARLVARRENSKDQEGRP